LWYADTWRLSSPCPASLNRRNLCPSACQYLFLYIKNKASQVRTPITPSAFKTPNER
jgi:hypothetical protein